MDIEQEKQRERPATKVSGSSVMKVSGIGIWYDPLVNPGSLAVRDDITIQVKKKLCDGGADGVIWHASAYKREDKRDVYVSDVVVKKALTSLHDCDPDKTGEAKEDRAILQSIFDTETEIMRNISHDNIIRLLYDDRDSLYHVYPLYDMDLSEYMQVFHDADDDMPANIVASIAKQLINAGEYLHSNGILYRDFKTSNVLVRSNGDCPMIVLTDFGKCVRARNELGELYASSNGVGSVAYIPLEAHFGGAYTTKSDVFAFMNVIFRIYTGAYLFDHEEEYIRPMPDKMIAFIYGDSADYDTDELSDRLDSVNISEPDEYKDSDSYETGGSDDDPDNDFDTEYRSLMFNLVHICSSYHVGNPFDIFPDDIIANLEPYMIPRELFEPAELSGGKSGSMMKRLKYIAAHGEIASSGSYNINSIISYWRPDDQQVNAMVTQFLLMGLHPDPLKRLSFRELQSSVLFTRSIA